MSRIVPLKPDLEDANLPPMFYLQFEQDEFSAFLANPTGVLTELGHPVKNLSVVVKDHVWDASNQEWVTDQTDARITARALPGSSSWGWICGYQDEQCVCERVLM